MGVDPGKVMRAGVDGPVAERLVPGARAAADLVVARAWGGWNHVPPDVHRRSGLADEQAGEGPGKTAGGEGSGMGALTDNAGFHAKWIEMVFQ